jgi:uncharacterized membrane protein
MAEFFQAYSNWILFFHVLGAVVWVGGMITIRFAVHPVLQQIEDEKVRLAKTLLILKNFFAIVRPMVGVIIITGVIMAMAMNYAQSGTFLAQIVHVKEAIWLIMFVNFVYIVLRRNRAEMLFLSGDIETTKKTLKPISHYLIPINIFLGIIALYLGGVLRGF